MKRRYEQKDKEYEVWNNFFIRYKMGSRIFNPNDTPGMDSIFFDKENITTELLTRIGDQFGKYMRGKTVNTAYIPYLNSMLEEIEKRFKAYQIKRVSAGYSEPTEMPKELLKEKLNYQARLDITDLEIENLTKRLKSFTDIAETKTDGDVLAFGLQGSFHLLGTHASNPDLMDTIREIDGQNCSLLPSGILIISDKRSPYNGLEVKTYRELCQTWKEEQKAKEKAKLKKLQIQCEEEGKLKPTRLPVRFGVRYSLSSLPAFPEGVRNYLTEPEEDSSSSSSMKRTKNK